MPARSSSTSGTSPAASARGEVLVERAAVGGPRVGRGRAHRVVALGQVGREVAQQPQTGIEQLGADRREVVVPHVEGVQRRLARLVERLVAVARRARRAAGSLAQHRRRRLQQGVALLEDLVVVGAHARPARLALDEQVVEEAAPLRRVALDEGEVLGGEEHGAHRAEHVAGPRHRGAAEPGPVGPTRRDLELDHRLALVAHDGSAHDRLRSPRTARAAGRWPPGATRASRGSRSPRRGSSCPGR